MRSSLTPLGPPVSRDRIITSFPKWYTPDACLQLKEHFHGQVSSTCQSRNTGTVGLRLSKVVVVGDLYVGKTSLIHRFCKNVFDRDYKATIGVDFEIERFEIAGIPYSLQMFWLWVQVCLAPGDPSHLRPVSICSHLENGAKRHLVHVPSSGLMYHPHPHPLPSLCSISFCLSASLPDPMSLPLSDPLASASPSSFPQNSPESFPQPHTFPLELWTLPSFSSGTWRILQASLCHQPYPLMCGFLPPSRLPCMAHSMLSAQLLLYLLLPTASVLVPFSFLSPWGSPLLLWFHFSILYVLLGLSRGIYGHQDGGHPLIDLSS